MLSEKSFLGPSARTMVQLPTKFTFAELREMGVDEVLIYCANRCGHRTELSADLWRDSSALRHRAAIRLHRLRQARR
jgi:hypothetical protein